MIIKIYGNDENVYIFSNIDEVCVINAFNGKCQSEEDVDIIGLEYEFDDECVPRFVEYKKDGRLKRIIIRNKAYICNDNGKTIEVVEAYKDVVVTE